MKLNLSIEYKTAWGEELVLCLEGKRYPLAYVADGLWQGEIARFNPEKTAQYSYEVVRDGYTVRKEWKKHTLALPAGIEPKEITVVDRWIDRPYDSPFYSSAFTNAIFGRKAEKAKKAPKGANVLLQVAAPALRPNEVLAITGSGKAFKNWTKIVPFEAVNFPVWTLALNVAEVFEYKLLVADKETLAPIAWEENFRILKDDGIIVVAASGIDHLRQMREVIYDEVLTKDSTPDVPDTFVLAEERSVRYELELTSHEQIMNLFGMTPFCYRTPKAGYERLNSLESLRVTVHTDFFIYKKSV